MVATHEEFQRQLDALVADAVNNGVDFGASYLCQVDEAHSYEIQFIELAETPPE